MLKNAFSRTKLLEAANMLKNAFSRIKFCFVKAFNYRKGQHKREFFLTTSEERLNNRMGRSGKEKRRDRATVISSLQLVFYEGDFKI